MSSASDTAVLAASDRAAVLHRTLAELCRAEVPLPAALRAAADDVGDGALAASVRAMADDVERGTPLGEAYAARADGFPRLYRGLVEAGIAAGDLPAVLDEIAAHAAARAEAEARIRRALAYPAVAAGFVVTVGATLAVFVGPMLDRLSNEIAETTSGGPSGGGLSLGALLASPWLPALVLGAGLALATAVVLLFTALRRPLDGCRGVTAPAFRWPVLGRMRLYASLSTLTAALAVLVRRRTPLADAFALAASSCDEPSLRARFDAMATAASQGASLADALREGAVLPPSLVWLVDSAERRGDAASALGDVARIYRERLARSAERAALWVTPVAEAAVGILVLLVSLAFLGRILGMISLLSQRA